MDNYELLKIVREIAYSILYKEKIKNRWELVEEITEKNKGISRNEAVWAISHLVNSGFLLKAIEEHSYILRFDAHLDL